MGLSLGRYASDSTILCAGRRISTIDSVGQFGLPLLATGIGCSFSNPYLLEWKRLTVNIGGLTRLSPEAMVAT